MDQDQITKWTRRGIREPVPEFVDDTEILNMTLQGVQHLGMLVMDGDPSYYNTRVSLSSNTHVFSKPSDSMSIMRVWDLLTAAITITAASNASPIVITAGTHGFSDDNIVFVHSVLGNTASNGTWKVTKINDDSFSLNGSTGNAGYASGGGVYEDPPNPPSIEKKDLREANLLDRRSWYPRGDEIVVDFKDFDDDILVDYVKRPSEITDIPDEFHMGLVAFNVINLIRFSDQDTPEGKREFFDKAASRKRYEKFLDITENQIRRSFQVSLEPDSIPQGIDFGDFV